LATQWRTTPVMADLNADGLMDLVMLDHEGFLAFFERTEREGKRTLLPGKRMFVAENPEREGAFDSNGRPASADFDRDGVNDFFMRGPNGEALFRCRDRKKDRDALRTAEGILPHPLEKGVLRPLPGPVPVRMNVSWAGGSGRRKLALTDWDSDGDLDVLVNSPSVTLLRNMGNRDGNIVLRDEGPLTPHVLAGHDTAPGLLDLEGDGRAGLLIGAEDGFLYHYPRTTDSP
ncbi:MAG TPA: VCBS repeat-containing protein, partial [Candidatus Hydrogenedentes bacterium]|nr:VCBS repeat-containing protein [Candidatus Hydrogenedentota bacterium]